MGDGELGQWILENALEKYIFFVLKRLNCTFWQKKCRNICVCQKKAVPLHAFLREYAREGV